jgi:Rrf2 family protein
MAIGQFFSQRFGYATHALGYMAKKPFGELTSLAELAEWMRTVWDAASETYLSNVIQRLARAGILRSHRGTSGGYSLAKPADRITLRELAEVLEGVAVEKCALSLGPECAREGRCGIRATLRNLEVQFLQSLARISIADIAAGMTIESRKTINLL